MPASSDQLLAKIPSSMQRVYLVGFMGAGKSTVGPFLARMLGWRFVDVDQHIEQQHGATVALLFATQGESAFRSMELRALSDLNQQSHIVVSLGGGALETQDVRTLLSNDAEGRVVFLQAPLPLLLQRCEAQGNSTARPLLQSSEVIYERFEKRRAHYEKAHLIVATQDLTPEEVAASIHQYVAALTQWK